MEVSELIERASGLTPGSDEHRIAHMQISLAEAGVDESTLKCEECDKPIALDDPLIYIIYGYTGSPGAVDTEPIPRVAAWCAEHRNSTEYNRHSEN